jgi:membrane protease YdiL (CAAX protease family)
VRKYIKALTPTTEFVVVVVVAFSYFMFGSLHRAVHPDGTVHHSHAGLAAMVVYEVFLIVVLAPFLALRGWTLERIGLVPGLKDTGIGFLLLVAVYLVWWFVWDVSSALSPSLAQTMTASSAKLVAASVPIVLAGIVSIVNPVFEECFVVGYVMSALRGRWPPVVGVNASVMLRLLYHLYQGPLGVLSVIPTGLIFSYWYARTGRLWPLVVAHAALDLVGLLSA